MFGYWLVGIVVVCCSVGWDCGFLEFTFDWAYVFKCLWFSGSCWWVCLRFVVLQVVFILLDFLSVCWCLPSGVDCCFRFRRYWLWVCLVICFWFWVLVNSVGYRGVYCILLCIAGFVLV